MGTPVTFNGTSYTVPSIGDASWGANVSNYLIAISSGCLQKTGGLFTLSADVNFGANFGLVSPYLKRYSTTSDIALTGFIRQKNTDTISWRNNANSADLALGVTSSDVLTFNSIPIVNLALGAAYTVLQMNSGGTAYTWATPTGTGAPVLQGTPTLTTPVLGVATATSINKVAFTAPATGSTLTIADGKTLTASNTLTFVGTDGQTFTFPNGSSTVMTLASADTITGVKTFGAAGNVGKLVIAGTTSGSTVLDATAIASGTLTLPAATDTLVGKATTDVLTNKTLTAPDITGGSYLNLLTQAAIRFNDDAGGDYVALQAPTGVTTHTLKLPATQGAASSVLTNDGSGNLTWGAALTTTLNQYNSFIGDASNVATATNTNLLGDINASTASATITVTIAAPGVVTDTSHGLATGDKMYLTTTGALPTGLSSSTTYYITRVDANSYKLATTRANAVASTNITTTGSQSGVHTRFSGALKFLNVSQIPGVIDGSAATASYVGEIIKSVFSSAAATSGTPTNFSNLTSVNLTPGRWLLYGQVVCERVASQNIGYIYLSAFSGNTLTDQVYGDNYVFSQWSAGNMTLHVGPWEVNISTAATYYFKYAQDGGTQTAANWDGKMLCHRIG